MWYPWEQETGKGGRLEWANHDDRGPKRNHYLLKQLCVRQGWPNCSIPGLGHWPRVPRPSWCILRHGREAVSQSHPLKGHVRTYALPPTMLTWFINHTAHEYYCFVEIGSFHVALAGLELLYRPGWPQLMEFCLSLSAGIKGVCHHG